jgi:hypothetical protein
VRSLQSARIATGATLRRLGSRLARGREAQGVLLGLGRDGIWTGRNGTGTGRAPTMPCRAPRRKSWQTAPNSRAGRESLTRAKCQTGPIMFNHGSQLNRRNLLTWELANGKFRATQRRRFPTTVSPLITVVQFRQIICCVPSSI